MSNNPVSAPNNPISDQESHPTDATGRPTMPEFCITDWAGLRAANDPPFPPSPFFLLTQLKTCRSGDRSARAVNLLAEAGFKKAYTVIDGFEGDTVRDPQSPFNGKRVKNGWKNSGIPWTYEIELELVYSPKKM